MLGKIVKVVVDRPLGSCHPNHKDMIYSVNYGYIEGIIAPDGDLYENAAETLADELYRACGIKIGKADSASKAFIIEENLNELADKPI